MARHGKKFHAKKSFTLPLAVVAGFIPMGKGIWDRRSSITEVGRYLSAATTGYLPATGQYQAVWTTQFIKEGLLPIAGGLIIHKLANKLGINALLARNRVPIIRI